MLARELKAGGAPFVILERSPERLEDARALGYLCLHAHASDETIVRQAGVEHARALATVLPEDAVNVFVTLSARNLNKSMLIIARGESPSTVTKLVYAGANEVVLPAHIGAERMAEIILYPNATKAMHGGERTDAMERELHGLGLELELAVAENGSKFAGLTVDEIEARVGPAFFIVAIDRTGAAMIIRPDRATRIEPAHGVVILGRANRAEALRGFQTDGGLPPTVRQSGERRTAGALPRTPPRGSAPWIPAKGGALGTLRLIGGTGGGHWAGLGCGLHAGRLPV